MTESLTSLSQSLADVVAGARASTFGLRRRGRCGGGRSGISATAWSEDLLVSVHHALPHHDAFTVVADDGDELEAEVVGRDRGTDLAVLRAVDGGLSPLAFASTEDLRVGSLVVALGRPGRTVRASLRTLGAVAAEVSTATGGRLERYLETDRAIPWGFVGGPALDADGRGIGIQTPALIRGADLAVPTETLRRVVEELQAHGRVRRGYLGVSVRPVRLPTRVREELGRRRGALVLAVAPGSPAEAAGLLLGDVLVELDGQPVRGPRDLGQALGTRFGAEVPCRVLRAGALVEVRATPAVRE